MPRFEVSYSLQGPNGSMVNAKDVVECEGSTHDEVEAALVVEIDRIMENSPVQFPKPYKPRIFLTVQVSK